MCVSLCFVFVLEFSKSLAAKLQPLNSLGGRETTLTGNPEKVTTRYTKTETPNTNEKRIYETPNTSNRKP